MLHAISERISDMVEGWFLDVEMLYDDRNGPCYLSIVKGSNIQKAHVRCLDDIFNNHVALSAFLASELGTHEARKFLYRHNVPKESLLWSLNHSGWADMSDVN